MAHDTAAVFVVMRAFIGGNGRRMGAIVIMIVIRNRRDAMFMQLRTQRSAQDRRPTGHGDRQA